MKNRIIHTLHAIVIMSVFLAITPTSSLKAQTSSDFEISKNLEILSSLYKELNTNYVDGANPSDLMKTNRKLKITGL